MRRKEKDRNSEWHFVKDKDGGEVQRAILEARSREAGISCMLAQGQTCKGKRKEKRKQKTLTVFWDKGEDMVNR